MKLSQLYSNDSRFHDIKFNEGFNLVLGTIVDKSDLNSSSHNLGKSTLVHLIDFMFLKEISDGNFLKDNYEKFKNHVFYMELKKSDDYFITIKRGVKNNTKISIKIHTEGNQDLRTEAIWDYSDLPLTTTDIDRNPKHIINHLWGFEEVLPFPFRTYLNYFLRTQYDYDQVFKLSKFRGSDSSWKPQVAYLLGYDGQYVLNKYEYERKITAEEVLLDKLEKELKVSVSDVNKIESLLTAKKKQRDQISQKLDNFDFYFKERELNQELVEEIESQIGQLNTMEYKLKYELEKIKNSLRKQMSYDVEAIKELFEEIEVVFPDDLSKTYDDLVRFNMRLTEERNRFLFKNLTDHELNLKTVAQQLEQLNARRNDILSVLQEKDSFAKFKTYQMDLVEKENEINQLQTKLESLNTLIDKTNSIESLKTKLGETISSLKTHLGDENELFASIQNSFTDLAQRILDETAILYHSINGNNNVDFEAKIVGFDEEQLTSKAEGYSYRKMLCVCFDLAVLLNYNRQEFYQFAYHDGCLESMSNTKKIRYLETVKGLCADKGIQYILTALEDDIPRDDKGDYILVKEDDIPIRLDNRKGHGGRLFGFEF